MKHTIVVILTLLLILGCDDILEVVDITNETVSVLAPVNDVTITDTEVTFTWSPVADAESYNVQIATPSFEAAAQIVTDSILSKTSMSHALTSGNYEWRVRAENSNYATAYATQKFTLLSPDLVDISSETVVISAPANEATFLTTDTINFTWNTNEGADEYDIEIATPDFQNPTETIAQETLTTTEFSVSNLSKNDYKCRIKAKNFGYETAYTEIGFTVNEP